MKQLFEELNQMLERGDEAVLVTVIASSGSTPRGTGSRMLVRKDGSIRGTIGGGAVEYHGIQIALDAMESKNSTVKGFTLTKNQVSDIGMICGGEVTVHFQYLNPENVALREFCRQAAAVFAGNEDSWLVLVIAGETYWQMGLCSRKKGKLVVSGEAECREDDKDGNLSDYLEELQRQHGDIWGSRARQFRMQEKTCYIEPFTQAGTVYVFGGGHVAQELVPVLAHVGFRCVVMDDRPEFANARIFPDAERTVVGDLERIGDFLTIGREDYVCVMTRGHAFDYLVQRQVLSCHPRYIGVIGSRNKVAAVTERLMGDGFSREEIEACHMPIGTRIYAETPAEIAISIAGELIAVRAGHSA